jgi:hypothetical protein
MDEIKTPVSLPSDLIAPRESIALELHHESDAGKKRPKKFLFYNKKTERNMPEFDDNYTWCIIVSHTHP